MLLCTVLSLLCLLSNISPTAVRSLSHCSEHWAELCCAVLGGVCRHSALEAMSLLGTGNTEIHSSRDGGSSLAPDPARGIGCKNAHEILLKLLSELNARSPLAKPISHRIKSS